MSKIAAPVRIPNLSSFVHPSGLPLDTTIFHSHLVPSPGGDREREKTYPFSCAREVVVVFSMVRPNRGLWCDTVSEKNSASRTKLMSRIVRLLRLTSSAFCCVRGVQKKDPECVKVVVRCRPMSRKEVRSMACYIPFLPMAYSDLHIRHHASHTTHCTSHMTYSASAKVQRDAHVKSGLFLLGCAPSLHPTSQHRRGDNGTMVRIEIDWPSCLHPPAPLPPLSSTLHSSRLKIRGSALWK